MIVGGLVAVLVILGIAYAVQQAQAPVRVQSTGGSMLKVVYVFFTGLLVATFVGVGIETFYPGPKYPEYPRELEGVNVCVGERPCPKMEGVPDATPEQRELAQSYDDALEAYQTESQTHARNVSLVALGFAVAAALLSLAAAERLHVVADGILLGGFFTLLYSMIRGFETEDMRYRFLLITIGMVALLAFGYSKFVHGEAAGKK